MKKQIIQIHLALNCGFYNVTHIIQHRQLQLRTLQKKKTEQFSTQFQAYIFMFSH